MLNKQINDDDDDNDDDFRSTEAEHAGDRRGLHGSDNRQIGILLTVNVTSKLYHVRVFQCSVCNEHTLTTPPLHRY